MGKTAWALPCRPCCSHCDSLQCSSPHRVLCLRCVSWSLVMLYLSLPESLVIIIQPSQAQAFVQAFVPHRAPGSNRALFLHFACMYA